MRQKGFVLDRGEFELAQFLIRQNFSQSHVARCSKKQKRQSGPNPPAVLQVT
jgi:hypothetical protein